MSGNEPWLRSGAATACRAVTSLTNSASPLLSLSSSGPSTGSFSSARLSPYAAWLAKGEMNQASAGPVTDVIAR